VDVSLNFLIFNPGDPIKDVTPDPKLGYPSVTILQNIGDPDIKPASSAITDFCSPLTSNTFTFGTSQDNPKTAANEGGKVYRKNPTTAGMQRFLFLCAYVRLRTMDALCWMRGHKLNDFPKARFCLRCYRVEGVDFAGTLSGKQVKH